MPQGELPVVNYPWVTSFTRTHNTKVQERYLHVKLNDLLKYKHNKSTVQSYLCGFITGYDR